MTVHNRQTVRPQEEQQNMTHRPSARRHRMPRRNPRMPASHSHRQPSARLPARPSSETIDEATRQTASARQRPPLLKPGDTVALISPASPIPTDGATAADITASVSERLGQVGLRTFVGAHATEVYGYLAGPDENRAQDLMDAFGNPDVDGILCMNGGYGTPRLLDLLNYDMIARNPKVFVGYSDITALHTVIGQRANLVTFLGPVGFELTRPFRPSNRVIDAFTWEWFIRAVMQPEPLGPLPTRAPWQAHPIECIVPGVARGLLIGGNLSLLSDTLGTPYEIDTQDKIVLIEEVNEAPYRIDRMLTQLRLAGKLQAAAGFIIAECINCVPADPYRPSLTLRQIMSAIVEPLGKPTVSGLAAGHGPGRLTLPLGVTVTIDADNADNCLIVVEESGVIANPGQRR